MYSPGSESGDCPEGHGNPPNPAAAAAAAAAALGDGGIPDGTHPQQVQQQMMGDASGAQQAAGFPESTRDISDEQSRALFAKPLSPGSARAQPRRRGVPRPHTSGGDEFARRRLLGQHVPMMAFRGTNMPQHTTTINTADTIFLPPQPTPEQDAAIALLLARGSARGPYDDEEEEQAAREAAAREAAAAAAVSGGSDNDEQPPQAPSSTSGPEDDEAYESLHF